VSKKKQRNAQQERPRAESKTTFDAIERFTRERPALLLGSVLVVAFVLGVLLFDIKPGIGGDDTTYVLQAHSLISKGILPIGFKSPGYPSLLALFMLVTGMNLVLLKGTSLLFYLASIASFYYIFRKRIEPMLLFMVLVLFALSALVLEYSHQTYSEMAFLLVELWTLHFLWKEEEHSEGNRTLALFLVALLAMVGFYIRAIGATLPMSIGLWYLLQKRWKTFAMFVGFCILLYVPWKAAEFAHGIVLMGQASDVFMVNPYSPALGEETIGGFAQRFLYNLFVHLNYIFPKALSLPYGEELGVADGRLLPTGMAFLGVLFSTVLILGIIRAIRKGTKEFRFLAVYLIVYLVSIWLALQTLYATPRMMVPMMPFLLLLFLFGIYDILHRMLGTGQNRTPSFKGWFVFAALLVFISTVSTVGSAVDANLPILKANLRGEEFQGYSIDWVNYLKACRWIARNLPRDSTGVICRKPELFQLYAPGFDAYGVFKVESTNPDTIVAHWKLWKMTHLLYDNFQWTTTLRRYVEPVAQKYPRMFELIHQEGAEYPAYVYKLDYALVDSAQKTMGAGK
jgi:hypothetical protein